MHGMRRKEQGEMSCMACEGRNRGKGVLRLACEGRSKVRICHAWYVKDLKEEG